MRNLWLHGIFTLTLSVLWGCEASITETVPAGENSTEGLNEALENCPVGEPCPIVTYAFANCLDLIPITPDRPIGVFDAQQGGVATWVTLVIANAPEENPFIQLEMLTEDGPLNYKEENGPKALKVPFLPLSDTIRYQDQYMVPFDSICCAKDFEEREGTLRITVTYPGLEPASTEWPFRLTEDPWPLDEDTGLREQCGCDAWPTNLPRDEDLCAESGFGSTDTLP